MDKFYGELITCITILFIMPDRLKSSKNSTFKSETRYYSGLLQFTLWVQNKKLHNSQ